jgi:hypothetical protein
MHTLLPWSETRRLRDGVQGVLRGVGELRGGAGVLVRNRTGLGRPNRDAPGGPVRSLRPAREVLYRHHPQSLQSGAHSVHLPSMCQHTLRGKLDQTEKRRAWLFCQLIHPLLDFLRSGMVCSLRSSRGREGTDPVTVQQPTREGTVLRSAREGTMMEKHGFYKRPPYAHAGRFCVSEVRGPPARATAG